jgi:2'-5' RNA ligase
MNGDATNLGTLRTFIAIDLPASLLQELAAIQERLQERLRAQELGKAVRWSPAKNLHLTLRFLGDTTPRQREQVTSRLQEVVAKATPFTLSVDASGRTLGGFPSLRQPRVLWASVDGDLNALNDLQSQVEAVAQSVGFAAEAKSFSPHLTLARAARDADRRALAQVGQFVGDFAKEMPEQASLTFQVDRLIFYRSELGAGGSRYTVLAELPFGA